MKQFGLERQHHRQPIRAIAQLVHATAPPRPHLRRNIVEHGNPVAPRGAGENQVELRIINQDQKVRLLAPDDSAQCAKRADRSPNSRGQLRKSKPVDILHLDDRAHAGRAHFLARNPEQLARRISRENFPCQIAAVKIARRLARNDHDADAARAVFQALVKRRWRFGIQWHRSDCIENPDLANSPARAVSIVLREVPADRVAYLIHGRSLLRHPFRQQCLAGADFARRAMRAAIAIEQALMSFRLVATAIAMQLRQQLRILLREFVRFLYRTDELVWIECQSRLRVFRRGSVRRLRSTRAAAMTRDAHCSARIAIHVRTEYRPQVGERQDRREQAADNYYPSHAAPPLFRVFLTSSTMSLAFTTSPLYSRTSRPSGPINIISTIWPTEPSGSTCLLSLKPASA